MYAPAILAQDLPEPETTLFYDSHLVNEQVEYLLPDKTSAEDMTEWDWVEMQPHKEITREISYVGENFERYSYIKILQTDRGNKWDYKLDSMVINPDASIIYDAEGAIISKMPHSETYLTTESKTREMMMNEGLSPALPFPSYEELSVEDIQNEGYHIEETENGYHIWNDFEEIFVNPSENIRVYQLLKEEYDIPYYVYESFEKSSQGYLYPVFKETMTKTLSKNGHCIVKLANEAFSDYELYYDPAVISNDREEPSVYSDFSIFPNPADDHIEITYTGEEFPSTSYQVQMTNHLNEVVLDRDNLNTANVEQIDLSGLPGGFYILRFSIAGYVFSKKIFKN